MVNTKNIPRFVFLFPIKVNKGMKIYINKSKLTYQVHKAQCPGSINKKFLTQETFYLSFIPKSCSYISFLTVDYIINVAQNKGYNLKNLKSIILM